MHLRGGAVICISASVEGIFVIVNTGALLAAVSIIVVSIGEYPT